MKRFLGSYCKIVYKLTGDKKSAVTGDVIDLNNSGFILIENKDGMHCLNMRKIISIKPRKKLWGKSYEFY